jgi:hypothetical protein
MWPNVTTGLANRVLAIVLRAYPASFRAAYARELLLTLRDQRRALSNTDGWGVAKFWARALADLLRSAAVERMTSGHARVASLGRRGALRVASGWLLLSLALGNVAYDVSEPKLSMGAFAILITAVSGLAGVRLVWRSRVAR